MTSSVTPAWCTLIQTYTDPSLWAQNVSSYSDLTFGYLATPGQKVSLSGGTLQDDGVTFTGIGSTDYLDVYSNTIASWYNFGSDGSGNTGYLGSDFTISVPEIDISLPTGITAFGLDLMSVYNTGSYNVNVNGTGYTSPVTQAAPTRVFFGATFTAPVTQIKLTMPGISGEVEMIDNFRFGTADAGGGTSEAPEALTMIMIGTGLIGITWLRRRAG